MGPSAGIFEFILQQVKINMVITKKKIKEIMNWPQINFQYPT